MKQNLTFLWRHNRLGLVASTVAFLYLVVALAPQFFAAHDPLQMTPDRLAPPSSTFLFGTDRYGRDIESRIVFGTQVSLAVGLLTMLCGTLLGATLGMVAGYFGGIVDYVIMRVMDTLFSFPSILLAIAIVAVMGSGLVPIVLAISITLTPTFARVARAPVLSIKEGEFVTAARSVGVMTPRLLLRHILPNTWSPILVQAALSFSGALVIEAALGFLGLGIQPPTPSLGSILNEARTYMEVAPWTVLYPGAALGLVILAANLLGDAVRDILDPRMRSI